MRHAATAPQHRRHLALTALSLALGLLLGASPASAADDSTRYIVAFKAGKGALGRHALAQARGQLRHEVHGQDAVSANLPAAALKALQNNPHVDYIEEDVKRYPLGGSSASTGAPYALGQQVPYGIKMVQADQLPDTYAANRKLCIIDSGIAASHEDLAGNSMAGEYDSGTGWWYTDENHHGTHVAGTIAAVNNAGVGVVGVNANQQIKLHIVKVFGADAWAYSSTLASAANKCAAAGANVISMSLGGSRSNKTEQRAFDSLAAKGILSVAAAGNAGTTALSYPAGYSSVVSVAAVDEAKLWASFSQYNSKVELAAPGVNVLSTVPPGAGSSSSLSVGSSVYAPGGMDGSPRLSASAPLADFGLGGAVNTAMAGKICLIQRGSYDFATKVLNCQNSGGVGAVVYNNATGGFGGTLGTTVTSIPSVTASDSEGAAMKNQFGQTASLAVSAANYAFYDGTSMATPHVSAVAALVWSYFPSCSAAQMRITLNNSAEDLGTAGRDTKYGYGLVRAKAAYERIKALGCGK